MAMKYKTEGGQAPAGSLGSDFTNWLQQGLQTGSFGSAGATSQAGAADPMGSTNGISGILNDLLAGGAGKVGGSMAQMISKQSDRDALALRARFGVGGGSAFGTPAAYSEALLRSETAPKLATAIGGLQESALAQLLPLFSQVYNKQTPQAETIGVQNPWVQAAQIALPLIGAGVGAMAGSPGAGASIGSSLGGAAGAMNKQPSNIDFSQQFQPQPWNLNGPVPMSNPMNFGYTPSFGY